MAQQIYPEIGNWYKTLDNQTFEVVAIDYEEGTIEIQYFNGDVEELDTDTWNEMAIYPSAAPGDWSGPFDNVERDDFGDIDLAMRSEDWSGPLGDLERNE